MTTPALAESAIQLSTTIIKSLCKGTDITSANVLEHMQTILAPHNSADRAYLIQVARSTVARIEELAQERDKCLKA